MKFRIKPVLAIMLAASLAACGDAKTSASEQPVAVQTVTGEIKLPAKYADILNNMPKLDPAMLEPVVISSEKSPTGAEDLRKMVELDNSETARELQTVAQRFKNAVRTGSGAKDGKLTPEMLADIEKLGKLLEEYSAQVQKLDIKDAEIKAVSERSIAMTEVANKMLVMIIEQRDIMSAAEKDAKDNKDAAAFVSELRERLQKNQADALAVQTNLQKAGNELAAKYSE